MRNLKRLEFEIRILEKIFGFKNIAYPRDGSWIKISSYRLPQEQCAYNLDKVTIQIKIPEDYDDVGVSEVFISRKLRIRKGIRGHKLPHTHTNYKKAVGKGYLWLCFEPSGSFTSLLDFINTLKLYFINPFKYQRL